MMNLCEMFTLTAAESKHGASRCVLGPTFSNGFFSSLPRQLVMVSHTVVLPRVFWLSRLLLMNSAAENVERRASIAAETAQPKPNKLASCPKPY